MNTLLDLFLTFMRVGGLTFGGGYAMLPVLQREVVEKRGWLAEEEVLDYYGISQVMPGLIAVNTALFIGNRVKGVKGGIVAQLGVVTPSLVVIMVIAAFISRFAELAAVQNAFAGIRVCVAVLIVNTVVKMRKNAIIDLPTLGIFAAVLLLSILTPASPILMVVCAGILGVLLRGLKGGAAA